MDAILLGELTDILGSMSTDSDTKHEEIKSLLNTIDTNVDSLVANNAAHGSQIYSTAGTYTWTAPEGVNMVYVVATAGTGGGGGGAGGNGCGRETSTPLAAGGGSGGCSQVITAICGVTPKNSYTIVIGAGGTGGAGGSASSDGSNGEFGTAGTAGGAGGQTKFGSMLIINGASGGEGGKVGSLANNDYDAPSAAEVSAGGAGGLLSTSSLCHVLHTYSAVKGKNCATPALQTSLYSQAGTAGGEAARTILNRSSGAGGGGGMTASDYKYAPDRTDGTAGSAGSCGYMRIIW